MGAQQSEGFDVRDTLFNAVARMPFFANYKKRKTKMLQVQPEHLPYLGVYIIDETMLPDGDGNAGNRRFIHTLRVGFSVIIATNDPDAAEQTIDKAFNTIMDGLWSDPFLNNCIDTFDPVTQIENAEGVVLESIERGFRRHVFGVSQFNNELPLAELQYDVSAKYRTTWIPIIRDDLLEIDIKVDVPDGTPVIDMPIILEAAP